MSKPKKQAAEHATTSAPSAVVEPSRDAGWYWTISPSGRRKKVKAKR